jgi:anti-sigma regulatory factor (Ser/Thr protein kinase)
MDRIAPHEIPLPAEPASVAVARRYFVGIAVDAGLPADVRDAGVLAVSELVTNAVLHGSDPITLRVTTLPRTVRVAVTDGSNRPPKPRPRVRTWAPGGNRRTDHGRGLTIVENLCHEWGCAPSVQSPGKTVWCNLTVDPAIS